MKHATLLAGLVAAGAVLGAGAVQAERSGAMPHDGASFETMDGDGDGEISRDEMQAHMQARFTGADTDGDGVLSRDELIAQGQKRLEAGVGRMLERFDADGDGALSAEEMPKPDEDRAARMFDMIDSDDSGGISQEEFAEMRDRMKDRREHRHSWFKKRDGDKP